MAHLILTIEDRKDKIVDKLSTVYSLNQISMDEYERLIKYSQTIETEKELKIFEKIVSEYNVDQYEYVKTPEPQQEQKKQNPSVGSNKNENVAILSTRQTTGPITSGNYVSILGDHKIVITEDDLINDETVLNFSVILGDAVIHVDDNISVVNRVIPILADVKITDNVGSRPGRKTLIITGNVILGDIKVKVRKKDKLSRIIDTGINPF